VVKNDPRNNKPGQVRLPIRVITLRSERGYLAANYDGSAAKWPKTLRSQFGKFYDVKKVRNTSVVNPRKLFWLAGLYQDGQVLILIGPAFSF
jgi:hypothetical protein